MGEDLRGRAAEINGARRRGGSALWLERDRDYSVFSGFHRNVIDIIACPAESTVNILPGIGEWPLGIKPNLVRHVGRRRRKAFSHEHGSSRFSVKDKK